MVEGEGERIIVIWWDNIAGELEAREPGLGYVSVCYKYPYVCLRGQCAIYKAYKVRDQW